MSIELQPGVPTVGHSGWQMWQSSISTMELLRRSQISARKGSVEDDNNADDLMSVTSKGSDKRRSRVLNDSFASSLSVDDYLLVVNIAAFVVMLIFGALCASLHGDGKRWLANSQVFNFSLLVTGCTTMSLQLFLACVYAVQWWSGV